MTCNVSGISRLSYWLTLVALLPNTLAAQTVSQVKNDRALVTWSEELPQKGDNCFAVDDSGKRRARVEVTGVRNDRVVARILKGRVIPGFTIACENTVPVEDTAPTLARERSSERTSSTSTRLKRSFGVELGHVSNKMSLTAKRGALSESLSLTGAGLLFGGFMTFPFGDRWDLKASVSIDPFRLKGNVSQASLCSDKTDCEVNYQYFNFSGQLRVAIIRQTSFRWFLGGGLSALYASSRSANIANLDTSAATNQTFNIATSVDIALGRSFYIPIEYQMQIYPSGDVKVSGTRITTGFGWSY